MYSPVLSRIESVSLLALLIANVPPLFGVLFFDWDLFQVLFLFWLESAVVGFYCVLRIVTIGGVVSSVLVPFFLLHYGLFMLAHLVLLLVLFAPEVLSSGEDLLPSIEVLRTLIVTAALPLVALLVSHGVSFFRNFIGRREYERTSVKRQFFAPYRRIILMHLVLIFGGWLLVLFDEPILGLSLLLVLKMVADGYAHIAEHSQLS